MAKRAFVFIVFPACRMRGPRCGLAAVNCSFDACNADFGIRLVFVAPFGKHALDALFSQLAVAGEVAREGFVCVVGGQKLGAGDSVEDFHSRVRFVLLLCRLAMREIAT